MKPIKSIFICLLCIALGACGAPTPNASAKPIRLIASMPILADLLENLTAGIADVEVSAVVPNGSDPHSFEPTPADARKVAQASAVFVIGANLEEAWLQKLLDSAGGARPLITVSDGVDLQKIADSDELDPHIWMDVDRWKQAADTAAKAIIALSPAISQKVNANATAYAAKLNAMDAGIKTQVAALPAGQRNLVTSHDALGYFAKRYGFTIIGAVMPGAGPSAQPSAREMQDLIELIKMHNAKAVFAEVGLNPALTQTVARESGAKVIDNLYVDTLSDPGGPAPTYLDMMTYNTALIVNALK